MILYFSGTGNSRYVAESLSSALRDSEVHFIPDCPDSLDAGGNDIIWVFPIYAWGVPPIVRDMLEHVEINNPRRHFMVCTCGDDTGRAPEMWRALIHKRGWHAAGAYSIEMPNTYVTLPGFDIDSDTVERRKLTAAPARIAAISRAIANNDGSTDVVRGIFPTFKTKVIYPWFVRYAMNPSKFNVDANRCVHCNACANGCPTHNIRLSGQTKTPEWDDNCAFCLRCYHTCPTHAIGYSNQTRHKGQYLFHKIGH